MTHVKFPGQLVTSSECIQSEAVQVGQWAEHPGAVGPVGPWRFADLGHQCPGVTCDLAWYCILYISVYDYMILYDMGVVAIPYLVRKNTRLSTRCKKMSGVPINDPSVSRLRHDLMVSSSQGDAEAEVFARNMVKLCENTLWQRGNETLHHFQNWLIFVSKPQTGHR